MPLHPLYGHEGTRNRLAGAVASGRLPQVLLLEGPPGIGKQRLALWLAQLLLCERPHALEPCGKCRSCRLALSLQHPDLHWLVPVELSKKGADADKQVDLVEEALVEEMAARRDHPLYEPPSGLASHGIASVRLLLRRAVLTPAMGQRKVFIIGDAERLVAQRGAEAAANALLKTLEEPPADTVFVLTASDPEALLPTIVSRVVRVRVQPVQDSVVTLFAQKELQLAGSASELREIAVSAEGSIGRLLALQKGGTGQGVPGSGGAVESYLTAARESGPSRYAFALRQPPYQARGAFTAMLDALLERLRGEVRAGPGGARTPQLVAAIARVIDAREMAQGNVNPQLLAAVLSEDLVADARGGS
jgi:DNA polymerase-3 subunit delta'